jgi:threonine/homoserine/homoserine lactone efflux protein
MEMSISASILAVAGALALGAMSPGPSFVMVARSAVASSRANALAAALGMGCGGIVFAAAALLGLKTLLSAVPWLYFTVKVLGGAYLAYLGYRLWRGAAQPLEIARTAAAAGPIRLERSFFLGLATQLSNPKTAVVYTGVFAALLPPNIPLQVAVTLPVIVFTIEAGWYAIVAMALSSARPRAAYLRHKAAMDRSAGAVMAFLGVKLVAAAHHG